MSFWSGANGTAIRALPLESDPIPSEWVREGQPTAESAVLFESADRRSTVAVWSCTVGSFDWHFTRDETVHVVEGVVTVTDPQGQPRTLRPGDVAVFSAGTASRWTVHEPMRKLAFLHSVCRPSSHPLQWLKAQLRRAKPMTSPAVRCALVVAGGAWALSDVVALGY